MTRALLCSRAEELGKALAAADWDMMLAQIELETVAELAVQLAERRELAQKLAEDASRRYADALREFMKLRELRDEQARGQAVAERTAIEAEALQ